MTDKVEVEFGAKIDGVADGVAKATSAVQEAASKMTAAFAQLGEQTKQLNEQFKSAFEGIHASLMKFNNAMFAVQNAMQGGHFFKEAIDGVISFTSETTRLSRTLGITSEEASTLNVALKLTGQSAEEFNGIAFKLLRQINANGDGLVEIGLKFRNADGSMKPLLDTMKDGAKLLLEYKEGVDRDSAAMYLFGRSAQEAMGILKLNEQVMARAKQMAEQYGLVVGPEGAAAARAYKQEQAAVGLVLEAMEHQIGEAVMPAFMGLASWFTSAGPNAVKAFTWALKNLIQFFEETIVIIRTVTNAFTMVGQMIGTVAGIVSEAISAAMHGDLSKAKNIVSTITKEISAIHQTAVDNRVKMYRDADARIKALWSETPPKAGEADPDPQGKGSRTWHKPETEAPQAEKNRMGEWAAALAEKEIAFQKEHQLREMSKAEELTYWQAILARTDLSEQEKVSLRRKSAQVELEILKKQRHDEIGLANEAIDEIARQQTAAVDARQQTAETEVALGRMTQAQLIEIKKKAEAEKYQIDVKAQMDRLALLKDDPNADPVALQKAQDRLLELHRKYLEQKATLDKQAAVEQQKTSTAVYSGIEQSMQHSIQGILSGQMTLGKALQSLWQGVVSAITGEIAKIAAAWLINLVKSKTIGLAEILDNAAVAGSGAYAATAMIPYIGPFMAPGAAATAYEGAASFAAGLSAAGGYDIPAGVNPVVQAHQKEMILPEKQANVIRDMADGGGDRKEIHLHVHALDAQDVKRYLKSNSSALAPALSRLARNFTQLSPT